MSNDNNQSKTVAANEKGKDAFLISPRTALTAAAVAFAAGLAGSWLLARRGRLPNPGAITKEEVMAMTRASTPSAKPAPSVTASGAPPRLRPVARIGGRIAPPTATNATPIPVPTASSAASSLAAAVSSQSGPSARDAMRSGLAMALDITGSSDDGKNSKSVSGPAVDASNISYAARAFGIGTALAVGFFASGTLALMWTLDVHDIPSFHARMQTLLGTRVHALNVKLQPHTEFLRVADPDSEAEALAHRDVDRLLAVTDQDGDHVLEEDDNA
ncbi:hypothetical protein BC828DRAFT_26496 [Blastocladiella britannica]|nr:hypothetical protein BC828DRAFT_26496 [Blastocladiella britannica]